MLFRSTIRNLDEERMSNEGIKAPNISYFQAMEFLRVFPYQVETSISTTASFNSKIGYNNQSTHANIRVIGCSGSYLKTAGFTVDQGRFFLNSETQSASHVVVIGYEVAQQLFKNTSAINQWIRVSGQYFKIVGITKSRGSSGFGGDKFILIPLPAARQYFTKIELKYSLHVIAGQSHQLPLLTEEARSIFRNLRRLSPGEPDNFELVKSDRFAKLLLDNIQFVTLGATIIGLITLLGSAIGLMNIMLVSVTERTREIGIRKALGASAASVRNQFLTESILLGICGGGIGIAAGIGIGNSIGWALGSSFFIPWFWMSMGFLLCIFVGLASGYMPAKKAAALNPIDALRFE